MKIKDRLKFILDAPVKEGKGEARLPDDHTVICDNEECNWHGTIGECPTEMDSEGWEYPEYEVLVCPSCGEYLDI